MPVYNTIPSRRRGGRRGQSIFKKVNRYSFVLNINTANRNSKDIQLSRDLFSTLFTHMGPIGPCKIHIKTIQVISLPFFAPTFTSFSLNGLFSFHQTKLPVPNYTAFMHFPLWPRYFSIHTLCPRGFPIQWNPPHNRPRFCLIQPPWLAVVKGPLVDDKASRLQTTRYCSLASNNSIWLPSENWLLCLITLVEVK